MSLVEKIKSLIEVRENTGANVQGEIDILFAQWEEENAVALSAPHPDHIAHADLIQSLG